MDDLAEKKCQPCEGGVQPFNQQEAEEYLKQVENWNLIKETPLKIRREFSFKNFKAALDFVNKVGELAEEEGHHPDLELGFGYVNINMHTHAIGGLSENDFILAKKIDLIKS